MHNLIKHIKQIAQICEENKVAYLFAVGSVTTGNNTPNDYVDLMVEIDEKDPLLYVETYRHLKLGLETLLSRPVNLLEPTKIKNAYLKKRINSTKVKLYHK
ncbi:nucleotidyltransferase domain-containing protein [Anditalea andensis]|uniref:Polymerase nucleotidyl transferase domain-containing protein n=1 Tax=Anditalea andensis TaxID=1048983 RepID=A0A074LDQ8_9BACT|nr:nucleotidyltransferase domain-containing protein [Anditalea andensis]KEO71932.1 hypothetical protein EL17_20665 [Anditalea andensis]